MAWVYLDDGMPDHPKVVAAERHHVLAPWLFVCGLAYCRRHLTGGRIPKEVVATLVRGYKGAMVTGLIKEGLWDDMGPEYVVHDYDKWNQGEDEQRNRRKEKARRAAEARWGNRDAPGNARAHAQALPEQMLEQCHPPALSLEPNSRESRAPTVTDPAPHNVTSLPAGRDRRSPFEDDFADAWKLYPRKEARKAALNAYRAQRRKGITAEELLTATRHFASSMTARGAEHIMLGGTFFGSNDRWRDYLEAPLDPGTSEGWKDPVF